MESTVMNKKKTQTPDKTKFVFHSFQPKDEWLENTQVKAVYMPEAYSKLIEKLKFPSTSPNESFGAYRVRLNIFRTLLMAQFDDVISVHFEQKELSGEKPWIYLNGDTSDTVIADLNYEVQNWIQSMVKRLFPSHLIADNWRSTTFQVTSLSLKYLYDERVYYFWQAYMTHLFYNDPKVVSISYMKRAGAGRNQPKFEATLDLTTEWHRIYDGSQYKLVSAPYSPKQGHYCSYVITSQLQPSGKIYFHFLKHRYLSYSGYLQRNRSRQTYLRFPSFNGKFVPVEITKTSTGEIVYSQGQEYILDMLSVFDGLPDPAALLQKPKEHYDVCLTHYVVDDKGKLNNIKAGISVLERSLLFSSLTNTFTGMMASHGSREIRLVTKPGKVPVFLGEERDLEIEVWTDKYPLFLKWLYQVMVELAEDYEETKHAPYMLDVQGGEEGVYVFRDKVSRSTRFTLSFVPTSNDIELLAPLPCNTEWERASSVSSRADEVINSVIVSSNETRYALLEIEAYHLMDGRESVWRDPKTALEIGFQQARTITQFFNPLGEFDPNDKGTKGRVKKALMDVLTRASMVNDRYITFRESGLLLGTTLYCPVIMEFKVKKQQSRFLYAISRFSEGELSVRYQGTDWMELKDSILYINRLKLDALLQSSSAGFSRWVEQVVGEEERENSLVLMEFSKMPYDIRSRFHTENVNSKYGYFDMRQQFNPTILKVEKGMASVGAGFLLENEGVYYMVPPKLPTVTNLSLDDHSRESNKQYVKRHTARLYMCKGVDDRLASLVYMSRNIITTIDGFVNEPYPIHVLSYVERLVKKSLGEMI